MHKTPPALYLLPAPLWPGTASTFITPYHRTIIKTTSVIAAENSQRAASFLRAAEPAWQASRCYFFDASGKDPSESREFLDMVEKEGAGLLVSDAGMPCIADPGHLIVRQAHQRGIRVTPLPGPVSFIMALAASGLSGQHFCFMGYPPRDKGLLVRKVVEIGQALSRESVPTYIFMETPQRANVFWEVLIEKLPSHAMLCLVQGLQSPEERIRTLTIAAWRHQKPSLLSKIPCVFLIGP
jgi:16S rRNA (cytidine1402-2'-O)-methyltransferase